MMKYKIEIEPSFSEHGGLSERTLLTLNHSENKNIKAHLTLAKSFKAEFDFSEVQFDVMQRGHLGRKVLNFTAKNLNHQNIWRILKPHSLWTGDSLTEISEQISFRFSLKRITKDKFQKLKVTGEDYFLREYTWTNCWLTFHQGYEGPEVWIDFPILDDVFDRILYNIVDAYPYLSPTVTGINLGDDTFDRRPESRHKLAKGCHLSITIFAIGGMSGAYSGTVIKGDKNFYNQKGIYFLGSNSFENTPSEIISNWHNCDASVDKSDLVVLSDTMELPFKVRYTLHKIQG